MPALFDLTDAEDMNLVRDAYDKIYGEDSFYNAYHHSSFTKLQKQMRSLTPEYNEQANFRFRAMSKKLHDFEREHIKSTCNKKQLEYIEEKKNIIPDRERQKIVDEVNEEHNKNKDFWSKIKKGG